jgi:hypothetical protein
LQDSPKYINTNHPVNFFIQCWDRKKGRLRKISSLKGKTFGEREDAEFGIEVFFDKQIDSVKFLRINAKLKG